MTGNAPYKTLPLAKGKVALVDADDHLRLSQFDWQIGRYVFRRYMTGGKQHTVTLQREVMRRPDQRIKFVNGNPLDCRKENLELRVKPNKRRKSLIGICGTSSAP
jgi:hypothetical protein